METNSNVRMDKNEALNPRGSKVKPASLYIVTFFLLAIIGSSFAQAPHKMSYQSVLRNTTGQLLANKSVGIKISILQGSESGTVVFAETHNANTNAFGLVSLQIGDGTPLTGTIAGLNWSAGPYFVRVDTDPNGGSSYSISGTTQMLSVPYALHAGSSSNAVVSLSAPSGTNANGGSISGNTLTLSLADASNPGLLKSADWTAFNNKIGSIAAGSNKVVIGGTSTAPTVDVNTANLGTIGLTVGSAGTNVAVTGSPANLGGSITLNIPDASATARGVVTTVAQTFAGEKTFTGNINQTGATTFSTGTGNVALNGNTGLAAGRTLTLNGATSGALTLAPAATTTTYSLTLPAAQGASGQVLTNNGSGVLSWSSPSASANYTASNGLAISGSDIQLGGALTTPTTLDLGDNDLSLTVDPAKTGRVVVSSLTTSGNVYISNWRAVSAWIDAPVRDIDYVIEIKIAGAATLPVILPDPATTTVGRAIVIRNSSSRAGTGGTYTFSAADIAKLQSNATTIPNNTSMFLVNDGTKWVRIIE